MPCTAAQRGMPVGPVNHPLDFYMVPRAAERRGMVQLCQQIHCFRDVPAEDTYQFTDITCDTK